MKLISSIIYRLSYRLKALNKIYAPNKSNSINNEGRFEGVNIEIIGENNQLIIKSGTVLQYSIIKIRGNNNTFFIDESCDIQKNEIWLHGNNNELTVGKNTMIVHSDIAVGENKQTLKIGENCMIASEIRTTDGHSILNDNGIRTNFDENIEIGNDSWICKGSMVLKGVKIGKGVMVATRALVTKDIPDYAMVAGTPAKVIKDKIKWDKRLL